MLTLILPFFASVLAAIIEYLRIRFSHGRLSNVNKFWTVNIGVVLFIVCLALSLDYYDEVSPIDVLIYLTYYASCRGMVYDIILNILRGLSIDYASKTTNSIIDRLFVNKSTFWITKFMYLIIAALSAIAWLTVNI